MSKATAVIDGKNHVADFCREFSTNIDGLYLLAHLLTGNHEAAEACLLAALENCLSGRPVAEHCVRSWSRWNVIRQAAKIVSSRTGFVTTKVSKPLDANRNAIILAIAGLPTLQRFAFVVTVLERYSVRECGILLHCQSREVVRARVGALQAIAADMQATSPFREISDSHVKSALMMFA